MERNGTDGQSVIVQSFFNANSERTIQPDFLSRFVPLSLMISKFRSVLSRPRVHFIALHPKGDRGCTNKGVVQKRDRKY